MKDWRFIFNNYVHHAKKIDGLFWDWPFEGTILRHGEDFLNQTILKTGQAFIDVGANVGAWTLRASPYYRTVVAFEPNLRVYRSLVRNVKLNRQKNITAKNLALDMRTGMTSQAVLHSLTPADQMQFQQVETSTLDRENIITTDTLVKIDVEGAALNVIKGGFRSIAKHHPEIIVEVHTKEEAKVPLLLPKYAWESKGRPAPLSGDWLYRENGQQVFLIGR